jgi:hypothetical protein
MDMAITSNRVTNNIKDMEPSKVTDTEVSYNYETVVAELMRNTISTYYTKSRPIQLWTWSAATELQPTQRI